MSKLSHARIYIFIKDGSKFRFDCVADNPELIIEDVKKKVEDNVKDYLFQDKLGLGKQIEDILSKFQFTKDKGNRMTRYQLQPIRRAVKNEYGTDLAFLIEVDREKFSAYYVDLKKHKLSDDTNLGEIKLIRPMKKIYDQAEELEKNIKKNGKIVIICNGEKEIIDEKDRKVKWQFYKRCYNGCDPEGSEANRYGYIADCLNQGMCYIDDDNA